MRSPTVPLAGGTPQGGDGARDDGPVDPRDQRTVPVRPGAAREAPAGGEASADPDRAERLVGRVLAGRYEVRRVLGRGGMGLVYEGRHITVGRGVAIKVLRADLARSTEAVARFHREARAAAAIGSEHIVEVFDFGYTEDGDAFIAMELLEGEDLGALVRREGALPLARALGIARQVARALETAHATGIVHRDLKSENVFVVRREGGDFIKLLDFGISKVSESDEGRGPMTSEGVVMGTPHYMAPEQVQGAVDPDHRIDLYALGCLLYEMLTGRLPFGGRNAVEVVFKHVHEAPVPPSKLRPDLPPDLEAVVLRALEKDRDRRYDSAAAMLSALGAVADRLERGEPAPLPISTRPASSPSRRRVLGLLALVAALSAGLLALRDPAPPPTLRRTREAPRAQQALTDAAVARPTPDAAIAPAVPWAEVAIDVRVTQPRGAMLELDGTLAGVGSAVVRGARGSRHRLAVRAHGFVAQEHEILFDRPTTLTFSLVRAPTGAIPARASHGAAVAGPRGVPDATAPSTAEATAHDPVALDPADGLKGSPYGSHAPRR